MKIYRSENTYRAKDVANAYFRFPFCWWQPEESNVAKLRLHSEVEVSVCFDTRIDIMVVDVRRNFSCVFRTSNSKQKYFSFTETG